MISSSLYPSCIRGISLIKTSLSSWIRTIAPGVSLSNFWLVFKAFSRDSFCFLRIVDFSLNSLFWLLSRSSLSFKIFSCLAFISASLISSVLSDAKTQKKRRNAYAFYVINKVDGLVKSPAIPQSGRVRVEPFEFTSNGGGGEALPRRVKRRNATFYEVINNSTT